MATRLVVCFDWMCTWPIGSVVIAFASTAPLECLSNAILAHVVALGLRRDVYCYMKINNCMHLPFYIDNEILRTSVAAINSV